MKKNKIGLLSASFIGISSIIGSGWLFAAYATAHVAGPAAILAWLIGGGIILLLALCFSEIASLYPRRGLSAVVATLSHHKYFGFPFAIANWLGIVAVIALEADATVEYLINIFPHLKPFLFINDSLTLYGNLLSFGLVVVYCLVNFWGVNIMAKTNNVLAVLKTVIPVITIIVILSVAFHPGNFTAATEGFAPYGFGSVFTAIISTGIIISFNGFQSVVSFASEVEKPHRNIPLSLVISILFCVGVYLLLQVTFIAGMPEQYLKGGWHKIVFNAPMVQLAGALGLGYLSSIIYFGAFVAPFGTAVTFTGTATRMFTAMANSEQMPGFFAHINPKFGLSRRSLVLNAVLATVFLFAFKSWTDLAIVLSLFHVFSYLPVPLAMIVFRKKIKSMKYKFKLKFGGFIAVFLFVVFNFLVMFGSSRVYFELIILMGIFQLVFIACSVRSAKNLATAFSESSPLFLYFITLGVMTALSPANGGEMHGVLFVVIGIIYSLIAFYLLLKLEKHDSAIAETAVEPYVDGH